jgi:RNA polymerase sigma-70 factor (ECF subfamily)
MESGLKSGSGDQMHGKPVGSEFPSSQWSLIARARATDRGEARAALTDLCRRYWYPIYAFVRRQTRSAADAEDLTQGFFAHVLARDVIARADPDRGRFRSFLLGCCRKFIAKDRRSKRTQKVGGGVLILDLDFGSAEDRYSREPADTADPEALFRRRWALTLLDDVLAALQTDYVGAGQGDLFSRLRPCLVADGERTPYADIARAVGMTEPAVRKAAQRLRDRFRAELRRRVAQTVAEPGEVDDEIRDLFAAVR